LSASGVAQALRAKLAKNVVPELRRIRGDVDHRIAAIERERASLVKPKIDPTDMAGALLRQEARAYLRGLESARCLRLLTEQPDQTMVAAALEAPSVLSGLSPEIHTLVEQAYLRQNHAPRVKAIDDKQEVLSLVRTATELAVREVRSHVAMAPHEF